MFIRPSISILFAPFVGLFFSSQAFCAPLDDWNALILEGSHAKFDGKYDVAAQSFSKAVTLAGKQKLPAKCLPISLCRLAEVELAANNVKEADSHFDQITTLMTSHRKTGKLDPQVNFWAVALGEAYLANHKPATRELCLKHACYLKTIVYGSAHRECTGCLVKLAECYLDEDKVDKAINVLEMREALLTKQVGRDADRYGDTLNELALKCEREHKYDRVKQLESVVIKTAETSRGSLKDGMPSFYALLGINALAKGRATEAKENFKNSIDQCANIKGSQNKQWACKYLDPVAVLLDDINFDDDSTIKEAAYKQMLSIYKNMSTNLDLQYHILLAIERIIFREAEIQHTKERLPEAKTYLKEAIAIIEVPNSRWKSHLPGLYVHLGCCNVRLGKYDEANKAFSKALELESEPKLFHEANNLIIWGLTLEYENQHRLAAEKFDQAFKIARGLPSKQRGTILADLLQKLAVKSQQCGDFKKAQDLFEKSSAEIMLQKKLNSKLGPDLYKRM